MRAPLQTTAAAAWVAFASMAYASTACVSSGGPAAGAAVASRGSSSPLPAASPGTARVRALYERGFTQAAIAAIAHADPHDATVPAWVVKLAETVPDTYELEQMTARFDATTCARNEDLAYLCARQLYGHAVGHAPPPERLVLAQMLLARVTPRSRFYVDAQFVAFAASVQSRQAVPAAAALQRARDAVPAGDPRGALATLDLARTYYSASIGLDAQGQPAIDDAKLSAAMKYYRAVPDTAGELARRSRVERGWVYFMAGDYGHLAETVAPFRADGAGSRGSDADVIEADILRGIAAFAECKYSDAGAAVAPVEARWAPVRAAAAALGEELVVAGDAARADRVRAVLAGPPSDVQRAVARAWGTGPVRRRLAYEKELDAEMARAGPPGVDDTDVRAERDAVARERARLEREIGKLVVVRLSWFVREIDDALEAAKAIRVDAARAGGRPCPAASAGSLSVPGPPRREG